MNGAHPNPPRGVCLLTIPANLLLLHINTERPSFNRQSAPSIITAHYPNPAHLINDARRPQWRTPNPGPRTSIRASPPRIFFITFPSPLPSLPLPLANPAHRSHNGRPLLHLRRRSPRRPPPHLPPLRPPTPTQSRPPLHSARVPHLRLLQSARTGRLHTARWNRACGRGRAPSHLRLCVWRRLYVGRTTDGAPAGSGAAVERY